MKRHPLEQAFADYGTALGEYESTSSTAYNVGAEVVKRLVDAGLKGQPVDMADLAAECEMCLTAGKRAEEKRVALKAAWKRIGDELDKAKRGA